MRPSYPDLLKRTLLVIGVALVPVLIWYLFSVILIAFGAVIFATLLWLGAEPFIRWCRLGENLALLLSGVLILIVIVTIGVLFGTQLGNELGDVIQRVNSGAAGLQAYLEESQFGKLVANEVSGSGLSVTSILKSLLTVSSSVIEGVTVALITGIYLAAQPRLYRDGLIQLFPPKQHVWALGKVNAIAAALRLWLIGQLIQMVLIGAMATVIIWALGVPSPIGLGLIAGLGEFVPYLGPIIAAIPAILVALTKSWDTALWTVAAYVVINQIEGHLVIPLIQRQLVFIPPVIILLGIVAFTTLFGPAAVVFAAPMSVVAFVAVKVFYVRDLLGETTDVPGEPS
jgi:predicted PurR-regulated permease PerM